MALPFRAFYWQCGGALKKPVRWNFHSNSQLKIKKYSTTCCSFSTISQSKSYYGNISPPCAYSKTYSTQPDPSDKPTNQLPTKEKKSSLFQRFKQMARDYWYVLIPVHGATSILWFGGFYYTVRSGVDVLGALQAVGVSERFMEPIRNSGAGYFALAFACYKVATPLRYAATLGVTTFSIKRLTTLGWIKPMPSKERIKEVIQEQKDSLQDKLTESKQQMRDKLPTKERIREVMQEKKDNFKEKFMESKQHYHSQVKEKSTQIKEKQGEIIEEMSRFKADMRNIKDRVKKM